MRRLGHVWSEHAKRLGFSIVFSPSHFPSNESHSRRWLLNAKAATRLVTVASKSFGSVDYLLLRLIGCQLFFDDSQPNRLRLEFLIKRKTELTHMEAYAQCNRMQQMAVITMNRGHEQSIPQKVKPRVAGETRFGQPAGRIRHSATAVLLF